MKNADMPAMPVDSMHNGLTKREELAARAMAGLLAKHGDDDYPRESIAGYAVAHADALLAELEKSQ